MSLVTMEFHLMVTNYVGTFSTLVNGVFLLLITVSPPDNLGIFRSQYYVGAFASFFFAAMQTWSANIIVPDGSLFVAFSARGLGELSFLTAFAACNLQFTMLSSNFAVRFAAVRGGWMKYYLTNHVLFYGLQFTCFLGAYIPPITLISPTPELRITANATFGDRFNYDFMNNFYLVSSYEHLLWGNVLVHQSVFAMAVGFQAGNILIMVVREPTESFRLRTNHFSRGHISRNTTSKKLQEVNNRLLRARIFQATFSFLFLFMPGLLLNSAMILRIDASNSSSLICSFMSFATLFNPFVDFTQTPGYRKKMMRIFFKKTSIRVGEITTSVGHVPMKQTSPVFVRVK